MVSGFAASQLFRKFIASKRSTQTAPSKETILTNRIQFKQLRKTKHKKKSPTGLETVRPKYKLGATTRIDTRPYAGSEANFKF